LRYGPAKAIAIELACRLTDWTHRAIGAHYGGIRGAALSVARRRIRECPATEAHLIERLLAELAEVATAGATAAPETPAIKSCLNYSR
jgi:hypothetical protein